MVQTASSDLSEPYSRIRPGRGFHPGPEQHRGREANAPQSDACELAAGIEPATC